MERATIKDIMKARERIGYNRRALAWLETGKKGPAEPFVTIENDYMAVKRNDRVNEAATQILREFLPHVIDMAAERIKSDTEALKARYPDVDFGEED